MNLFQFERMNSNVEKNVEKKMTIGAVLATKYSFE